jgi:hypothetical protein
MIFLSLATILMNAKAQDKYSLTYKFQPGKSYTYKSDMNMESVQEMMGNEMKINFDGYFTGVYNVQSVSPEGEITCLYTLTDSKIHTTGMGSDTTITMPKDALDTSILVFSAHGKTLHKEASDTAVPKKKKGIFSNLENAKLFELPKNSVAIGETWTVNSTDTTEVGNGQMITTTKTDYTLIGKEEVLGHSCLRFDYKGTSETTGKMNQMGMDMFIEGTGEPSGTAWFDPEMGMVIKSESVMANEMTMAMTGQNQMTIPMTQKITTIQTLVEK